MQNVINFQSFLMDHYLAFAVLIAWVITWKGFALWKAGRNNSPIWFIILLLVNTLGLLEIIYIFAVKNKENDSETIIPISAPIVKEETKVKIVAEEKKEEAPTPATEIKQEEIQQEINQ